jgi:hypothetical protein
VSTRFADDLQLAERTTERSRLYVGHVQLRLPPLVTARAGRQWIQEGPSGLSLDGIHVSVRPSRLVDVRVWGGARAPFDRAVEVEGLDDDGALGARLMLRPDRRVRVAGSFAYHERNGRIAERPLGLEWALSPAPRLRIVGRVSYDLELEEWKRSEIRARWQRTPTCPVLALQLIDRRPSVDADSYFSRFVDDRITMARFTARYERRNRFGGELEYVGTYVAGGSSRRIGLAFLAPVGRIGYSLRLGDAGEESRLFGDAGAQALRWLWIEVGATLQTYALLEDAPESEERDLTTMYGRLRATLRPGLGVHLEVQSLDNPFYAEDFRMLAGLDLTVGRGSSRFGLDRGGWLR